MPIKILVETRCVMCVGGSLWKFSCTWAVIFFSYSGDYLLLLLGRLSSPLTRAVIFSYSLLLSGGCPFRPIEVGPASGSLSALPLLLLRGRPARSGAAVRAPHPECPGESAPSSGWFLGLWLGRWGRWHFLSANSFALGGAVSRRRRAHLVVAQLEFRV